MTEADWKRLKEIRPALLEQAIAAWPREMCGMVLIRGGQTIAKPLSNVAPEKHRFNADPRELYELEMSLERPDTLLLATVHSHPHSAPWMSATDYDYALGRPEVQHLIVGRRMDGDFAVGDPTHEDTWVVSAWRVRRGSLIVRGVP